MIEIADKTRIAQLKKLWLSGYDDPESYVDLFFAKAFPRCRCICEVIRDQAVGALYLFPCSLNAGRQPGFYLYAGVVLPEHRNRGIYNGIVLTAMQLAKEEGRFGVCYPGPGMDSYYNRLGFTKRCEADHFSFVRKMKNDSDEKENLRFIPIQPECASEILTHAPNACLPGSILWDADMTEYIVAENEFCDGFFDRVTVDGKTFFLLGQKTADTVKIAETDLPLRVIRKIKDSLMEHYTAERLTVSYPAGKYKDGNMERVMSCLGTAEVCAADPWFVLTML